MEVWLVLVDNFCEFGEEKAVCNFGQPFIVLQLTLGMRNGNAFIVILRVLWLNVRLSSFR